MEQEQLISLIREFSLKTSMFPDTPPGRTQVGCHDVDVGQAPPVKQHPYRLNPDKLQIICEEVDYMLENSIIELSDSSQWSSPCVLVPMPNGNYHIPRNFHSFCG